MKKGIFEFKRRIMHIVIYGTGGVGGYFGARLAQSGNEVTYIARGKHLEAIQKNGLQLESFKGDYLQYPANATDNITKVENIDLILICVKAWQLIEVAHEIKPVLNDKTMVISLLNGIQNQDILKGILGKDYVLGGLCKIVSFIEDFGIIKHASYEPTIVFGELSNIISSRALALKNILTDAKITTKLSANILKDIWTKFLYISTVSGIGALTRSTIGEMLEIEEVRDIMHKTAKEIVAISEAKKVNLPSNIIEKQFEIINSQPYNTTSSLQRDIMNGKPSELEAQNGTIVQLGKEFGIPTPTNDFIYYCLKPLEKRARKP